MIIIKKLLIGIIYFILLALLLLMNGTANINDIIPIMCILMIPILLSLDYRAPSFSIISPYILIMVISFIPISNYHREVGINTLNLIWSVVLIALFYAMINNVNSIRKIKYNSTRRILFSNYLFIILFYYLLTIINILIAGYIPLIDGILYGDSKHLDFGISGLYGFYLAYANFVAIFSYYAYLSIKKNYYLYVYVSILIIMLLFVSRLNVLSILIESVIIYNFVRHKIKFVKISFLLLVFLFFFSLTGDLVRNVNIKRLVDIDSNFNYLPNIFVWVYSYFYFNILNLDNVIYSSLYPIYDGSSFANLLPNILRPDFNHTILLERTNFTVAPFLLPLYRDLGLLGCVLFTISIMYISYFFYKKIQFSNSFYYISIYSVLYFCSIMSFFNNFWFYLPIIFQIAFIIVLFPFLTKKVNA